MYNLDCVCIDQQIKDIVFLSVYTIYLIMSLVSDKLQELCQMQDATISLLKS